MNKDTDISILTKEDIELIKMAIKNAKDTRTKLWDQESLSTIKRKLKNNLRKILKERCCYCCKNTIGEFSMVLDIEHILPKSLYNQYELSPFNISVACKRCNMEIKGVDDNFLNDKELAKTEPENIDNYKFIHPNLEDYFAHIQYDVSIKNDEKIIKYTILNDSSKGKYTYDYFELEQLEYNTINEAQGIEINEITFSNLIPKNIVKDIETLLGKN